VTVQFPVFLGSRGKAIADTAAISAPLQAFTLGTEVGVPTGTSLTPTTGIPGFDATESLTLTHPISGATTTVTASVFRRRSWTTKIQPTPTAGSTWLFDQCEFNVASDFQCVDLIDTNGVNNQMAPIAVFRQCTFNGDNITNRGGNIGFAWMDRCDVRNCVDAVGGLYYSVIMNSNFIGGGTSVDDHADGLQCAGIGKTTLYHNWISSGTGPGQSSAMLFKNDFSAIDDVKVYYCGLDRGGWCMQFRGDGPASGDVTNVDVRYCRWQNNHGFGPVDFAEATVTGWVDNALTNGTVISNPAP
jgi:hypothetical protein